MKKAKGALHSRICDKKTSWLICGVISGTYK